MGRGQLSARNSLDSQIMMNSEVFSGNSPEVIK